MVMSDISFDPDKSKFNIMKTNVAHSEETFLNEHQVLIDGCKKSDQKSQFQIYKLYYKGMYNISLRIVKNTSEAEDIMQESFLSAFENIRTYSGTVSFGAWLKKIVENRSLDLLRKKSKMIFEDIECHQEIQENCQDRIYISNDTDVKMNRTLEGIKRLPGRCREILSLYLFEGYDHDEIGEILSISSSTSRSQFSRAKQKLIREIGGR
jgi:RNA polymerase sigma factor (sigma-70 family)